jgi:hypothetical protein
LKQRLNELALAGQLGVADGDRRPVGVEPSEGLGGGQDTRLIESLLDTLLEVEHGGGVRDLHRDGECGICAANDGDGHRASWVGGSNLHQGVLKTPH